MAVEVSFPKLLRRFCFIIDLGLITGGSKDPKEALEILRGLDNSEGALDRCGDFSLLPIGGGFRLFKGFFKLALEG